MMRLSLLLGLCMISVLAFCQPFPIIKFGTEHGIGHSIVYRIYQDKKGFLRFSTDNGLTRYDGNQFRNFVAKDGLRSNFVFGLAENDSAMVISTFGGGLQLTNGLQLDTINRIAPAITFPINITQDDSALWVVDRQLKLYRITKSITKEFSNQVSYITKAASQVVKTSHGILICSYGLYRYDTKSDSIKKVDSRLINTKPSYIYGLTELPDGRLLTSATFGLDLIDLKGGTSTRVFTGNFSLGSRNILVCKDGTILAAEINGTLWRLSADFQSREKILENVVVNDLLQDKDGRVWLATYGQGVWCLPSFSARMRPLQGLLNPSIAYLKRTRSVIVSSVNGKLFNVRKDKLIDNTLLPAALQFKDRTNTSLATYFYESKDSAELIVGTLFGIIRQIGNSIDTIYEARSQSAFLKDSRGQYWAGMRTGLLKIKSDFKQRQLVALFRNKIIRSLAEDGAQKILVGTNDGLYQQSGDTWIRYGKTQNLTNEYVNALLYDARRKLTWIASNEGIFKMDAQNKIEMVYEGIRCNSLVLDRRGFLWGGTSKGLLFYDEKNNQILSDDRGIDGDTFGIAYQPDGDVLYVLSSKGVTALTLTSFIEHLKFIPPRIIVTEQIVNGQTVLLGKTLTELPSNTSSITLRIAVPYFSNAQQWNLYYQVNDEGWQNAGDNRDLNFLKLPFGKVDIQLQMRDDINQRQSELVTIQYLVHTPLYRTKEFIIIAIFTFLLLSILSFLALMHYFNKRRELKFINEQRKAELEQKVLRNMLNPHFLNNAVNSIQVFVTRNDQRKTLSYLAKFARLMRVNLELLEKSMIPLEKELQNIELYLEFEVLRFEGKLRYQLIADPNLNLSKLKVPSLVLQPFVENAIWHGILPRPEGGEVFIRVSERNSVITLTIEDDGIGLEETKKRKQSSSISDKPSRGLGLIRDRFEILNQRKAGYHFIIEDRKETSPDQTGTIVSIQLPVVY
jgi:ligand-binding sensor domain-containing protein/anti-sigma regulatory factor (Ser/Thr protein kinase)